MLRFILGAVAAAIVAGCFLTPIVYSLLLKIWADSPWPFSRVFDRVVLFGAVLYLVAYRKKLISLFSEKNESLSFKVSRNKTWIAIAGALITFIPAMLVLPWVIEGKFEFRDFGTLDWGKLVPKLLLTAIVVSVLEEVVFRLLLFKGLALRFGVFAGMCVSSLVYAVVHFLTPVKTYQYPGFSLLVGVEYFAEVISRLGEDGVTRGILGLFLVGLVLSYSVFKTKGLALAIGLHAGWILAVKASFYLTVEVPGSVLLSGLGRRYFLVGEPIVWALILLTLSVLVLINKKHLLGQR